MNIFEPITTEQVITALSSKDTIDSTAVWNTVKEIFYSRLPDVRCQIRNNMTEIIAKAMTERK